MSKAFSDSSIKYDIGIVLKEIDKPDVKKRFLLRLVPYFNLRIFIPKYVSYL